MFAANLIMLIVSLIIIGAITVFGIQKIIETGTQRKKLADLLIDVSFTKDALLKKKRAES